MSAHTCCWILRAAEPGVDAAYCGKPTRYKMVRDDDDNLVREYKHFCDEHQAKVDADTGGWGRDMP